MEKTLLKTLQDKYGDEYDIQEEEKFYEITFPDGTVGKSSRDYTGKASCIYANKDTYTGDFVNGVRHDKGRYIYANNHIELEEG